MTGPLGLDERLWDILACPCEAHAPLRVDEGTQQLVCTVCDAHFSVEDGVPIMLLPDTP
jgi:uncharacterized protein YbaR (Trm112 family)